MGRLLEALARHGQLCLVAGLLAGLLLPGLAATLRPHLSELVALLLFLSAFRVGFRAVIGSLRDLGRGTAQALVLQLVLPLVALGLLVSLNLSHSPFALAAVLMLSAPSITGAPNFTAMIGRDPAAAMRLLVIGTALFPFTVLPVLWGLGLPGLSGGDVPAAAFRLMVVILGAVAAGFAARAVFLPDPDIRQRQQLDGLGALALAVIVVGLMSAIGPLLREDGGRLLMWLAAVMALNLGLQTAVFFATRRRMGAEAVPLSVVAGNRNIALFLLAVPEQVMDPLLIFIGCYQVPMYLTPMLMGRLYRGAEERA